MAEFNFPAKTPGEAGDTYRAPNGVLYVWDGNAWKTVGPDNIPDLETTFVEVAGDNMTGDLTLGGDKIVLNADNGIISASGNVNGLRFLSRREGADPHTKFNFRGYHENTLSSQIFADGSFQANGDIRLGTINSGSELPENDATIVLKSSDGSITAVGNITATTDSVNKALIASNGYFESDRDDDNKYAFVAKSNGNQNFLVTANGRLTVGDSSNFGVIDQTGFFVSNRDNASRSLIEGKLNNSITFVASADGTTKIGGTLPAAPNIELKNDGSITAANGQAKINSSGSIYLEDTDAAQGLYVGRNGPGDYNAFIGGDGQITAAAGLFSNDEVQIYRATTGVDNSLIRAYSDVGGTRKEQFELTADGSITTKGEIAYVNPDPGGEAKVFAIYNSGDGTKTYPTFQIDSDGSIHLGGADLDNNDPSISLKEDGSITAAGGVVSQAIINPGGESDWSKYTLFKGRQVDNVSGGAGDVLSIDGNGDFRLGGTLPSAPNIELKAGDGEIKGKKITATSQMFGYWGTDNQFLAKNDGVTVIREDKNPARACFTGKGGGDTTSHIFADGSAKFAGTVQQNATISRSVIIELEADDENNYVSTTDAEGNTTTVYNGPTLNVGDRLTKTDAALQALKTAAAAASDFTSLKAAIATALADI